MNETENIKREGEKTSLPSLPNVSTLNQTYTPIKSNTFKLPSLSNSSKHTPQTDSQESPEQLNPKLTLPPLDSVSDGYYKNKDACSNKVRTKETEGAPKEDISENLNSIVEADLDNLDNLDSPDSTDILDNSDNLESLEGLESLDDSEILENLENLDNSEDSRDIFHPVAPKEIVWDDVGIDEGDYEENEEIGAEEKRPKNRKTKLKNLFNKTNKPKKGELKNEETMSNPEKLKNTPDNKFKELDDEAIRDVMSSFVDKLPFKRTSNPKSSPAKGNTKIKSKKTTASKKIKTILGALLIAILCFATLFLIVSKNTDPGMQLHNISFTKEENGKKVIANNFEVTNINSVGVNLENLGETSVSFLMDVSFSTGGLFSKEKFQCRSDIVLLEKGEKEYHFLDCDGLKEADKYKAQFNLFILES